MSAKKLKVGDAQLDWAQIHWFHAENARHFDSYSNVDNKEKSPLSDLGFEIIPATDKKARSVSGRTPGGLVYDLYGGDGWDSSQGTCKVGTVEHIAALRAATVESLIAAAIKEREEMLALWEAQDLTKAMAPVIRAKWFPNGESVEIVAIGNECFRRSLAAAGAIYRRSLPDPETGFPLAEDFGYLVSVKVTEWESEVARIVSHLRENTMKDSGRVKLDTLDLLKSAQQIMHVDPLAFSESMLQNQCNLKRGTAQKLSEIVLANRKWRALDIVNRCFKAPPQGGVVKYTNDCYLPAESLQATPLRNLRNGKSAHDSTKPAKVGEATYHRYFREVVTGSGPTEAKPLDAKEQANLKDSPNFVVSAIATAIREGDKAFLALLDSQAKEWNELFADYLPFTVGETVIGATGEDDSDSDSDSEVESESATEEVETTEE